MTELDPQDKVLLDLLRSMITSNWDLHGKRIVNAGDSIGLQDYVTRKELSGTSGSTPITGTLNVIPKYGSTGLIPSNLSDNGTTLILGDGTSADGDMWIGAGHSVDFKLTSWSNSNAGSLISMLKARGNSSFPSNVVQDDLIGSLFARGYSGGSFRNSAIIDFFVDGPVTSGSIPPGRISFYLANTSFTLGERARITGDGIVALRTGVATSFNQLLNSHVVRYNCSSWSGTNAQDLYIDTRMEPLSSILYQLHMFDNAGSVIGSWVRTAGHPADLYVGIDRVTDFSSNSNGRVVCGGSGGFISVTALTNSSTISMSIVAGDAGYISCAKQGSGTALPLKFNIGGTRFQIDQDGTIHMYLGGSLKTLGVSGGVVTAA